MPEGHTIRSLANRWTTEIGASFTITSPSGRVRDTAAIDGQQLTMVEAWGKHLFLGFENDLWVHIHLGRFGRFHWHPAAELAEPAANVRLRLVSETLGVDLVGPITCEVVDETGKAAAEAKLGDDPLQPGDGKRARSAIQRTSRPIGLLLMEQDIIAGIGNIYRAELLWRSWVSPFRPGADVDNALFAQLWADARLLLRQGVEEHEYGQPTHTVGLPLPDGTNPQPVGLATRGNHTQVYQREGLPCSRCGTNIKREDMAGRALFYCPVCQAA